VRVLIVDDDQSLRELLARRLRRLAPVTQICTAENGRQALDQIGRESPDLVITDLRMPVCDGLRLAEEIERSRPSIPVVLMSSHVPPEIAERSSALGLRAVFSKDELQRSLPQLLELLLVSAADQD